MTQVDEKFLAYPESVRPKMQALRELILGLSDEVGPIQETLKWGEPSYQTKRGSTVRIDWKEKAPDVLGVYFICSTRLIETFKEVYSDEFDFETNRAVLLPLSRKLPAKPLKHCVSVALRYHDVKQQPLLGM